MASRNPVDKKIPQQHVFSEDVEELYTRVHKIAKDQKARVLRVAAMDLPSVALMVQDLDAFVQQAVELGGGIVYLAPDDLGGMLEEHIDVVDELREAIPPGEDEEEREAAEAMTESLLRLQGLQNALGGSAFRVGYLREGVMHEILIEDDEAAPGAALAELTLRGELDEYEEDVEEQFVA